MIAKDHEGCPMPQVLSSDNMVRNLEREGT